MIFWQLASAETLSETFLAAKRKSLSDFLTPLLEESVEQPVKFRLNMLATVILQIKVPFNWLMGLPKIAWYIVVGRLWYNNIDSKNNLGYNFCHQDRESK